MSGYEPPQIIKPGFASAAERQSSYGLLEYLGTRSFRRVIGVLGVGSAAILAYFLYKKSVATRLAAADKLLELEKTQESAPPAEEIKEDEKKVILYQVPRGFFTPAVAPFALKLETFMRVAKIPYEVHLSTTKHEVNTPWIRVGDEEIRNNHECIRFLINTFNIKLCEGAPNSRKTASYLVDTMLDSKIYWAVALWRWVYDEGKTMKDIQPLVPTGEEVLENVKESVLRSAHYNGIGRLPEEEVISNAIQDLNHLSAALGKHPFFLGEEAGEVDCNAFSILAQMVWNMPGSAFEQAIRKHKSLMDFVIRMRERFWPDWDDLIQNPQESKFTSQVSLIDPLSKEGVVGKSSGIAAKSNVSLDTPVKVDSSSILQSEETNANIEASSVTNAKSTASNKSIRGIQLNEQTKSAATNEQAQPANATAAEEVKPSSRGRTLTGPEIRSRSASLPPAEVNNCPTTASKNVPAAVTDAQSFNYPSPTKTPISSYNPTAAVSQYISQKQQQELTPRHPVSIRDIVNNSNNNNASRMPVNLTQEQTMQMKNHHIQHHQVSVQREGQNKFQQVRNGINAMSTKINSESNYSDRQQEQFSQNSQPQQVAPASTYPAGRNFRDGTQVQHQVQPPNSGVPMTYQQASNVPTEQYPSKSLNLNPPEFLKGLERAAQAAMLSHASRTGKNEHYPQTSELMQQYSNVQGYQHQSLPASTHYPQMDNAQPAPSQIYGRYWQ